MLSTKRDLTCLKWLDVKYELTEDTCKYHRIEALGRPRAKVEAERARRSPLARSGAGNNGLGSGTQDRDAQAGRGAGSASQTSAARTTPRGWDASCGGGPVASAGGNAPPTSG